MFQRWLILTAALPLGMALIFNPVPAGASDRNQGFSGKWVMDRKSSHGSEILDELWQSIKVGNSGIVIESHFAEPKSAVAPLLYLGIMTSSIKLAANGDESQNQLGPYLHVSKTTIDGNKMITEWAAQLNGDPVQGKWVRTLSEDGRRMTLDIVENCTHDQKGEASLVFLRK